MSYAFKDRNRPPAWGAYRHRASNRLLIPVYAVEWFLEWMAYMLGKSSIVEILEYMGSFSILFAAIVYFAGASNRLKQKHYQAWQVIDMAQGKGGNGGRIDAMQELNSDHVSLIGVDASGAYLQGLRLERAQARRASFAAADLRNADFQGANLPDSDFSSANLREANLRGCHLADSQLDNVDLTGADLSGADLSGVTLDGADLQEVNLDHVKNWRDIKSLRGANILEVRNPPAGFDAWAKKNGAVEIKTE